MAAALANATLGKGVTAESAGISPGRGGAAQNASQVVLERTGRDLAGHHPRDVADLDLGRFDFVIALDPAAETMLELLGVASSRLILWDVPDPYGGDLDTYKETADRIVALIEENRGSFA